MGERINQLYSWDYIQPGRGIKGHRGEPENVMPRKRSQTEKATYCVTPFTWNIQNGESTVRYNKVTLPRTVGVKTQGDSQWAQGAPPGINAHFLEPEAAAGTPHPHEAADTTELCTSVDSICVSPRT